MQECRSNKRERFSRVPRLSDTRYSAKGTKGKWRYASSKAEVPKGNGDMQAEKPTKGKWRYASSNRDIQVAKRD